MRPYEELAAAIVQQAADDYRSALKRLSINPGNRKAAKDCEEIEDFFCSAWFSVLTDLNGEKVMDRLRKERAA